MAEQNLTKSRWDFHLNLIAKLYVDDRLNYKEISDHLATLDFFVTGNTIKAKLHEWRIRRFTPQEENHLMAASYLYHTNIGQSVKFRRWGIEYEQDKIMEFLRKRPDVQPSSDKLPQYLEVVFSATDGAIDLEDSPLQSTTPQNLENQAQQELETSAAVRNDTGRLRKKRKHARSTCHSRERQAVLVPENYGQASTGQTKPQYQEDNIDDGETNGNIDSNNSENEKNSHKDPRNLKISELENAIRTIDLLCHEIGIKDQTATDVIKKSKQLLEMAKEGENQVSTEENETDWGPMHHAASCNNVKILQCLLKKGAKVDIGAGTGETPLILAALEGHVDALNFLVFEANANLDIVDNDGNTALHYAISARSLRCALILVGKGANVDIANENGVTALHVACYCPNMQTLVEQIIEKTTKINSQDEGRCTALHLATRFKNWNYVKLLVEAQASLNTQDKTGWTPLMLAAKEGRLSTVKLLVESGANVRSRNQNSYTALILAIAKEHNDVAEYLIENSSPLNPDGRCLARYKEELEHDRVAQEAASVLAGKSKRLCGVRQPPIISGFRTSRAQPDGSSGISGHSLQELSPNALHELAKSITKIAEQKQSIADASTHFATYGLGEMDIFFPTNASYTELQRQTTLGDFDFLGGVNLSSDTNSAYTNFMSGELNMNM